MTPSPLVQVPDTERVVVSTPSYLSNLTELLRTEPKRNVANYMMWRAARASVGFLSEDIRLEIQEHCNSSEVFIQNWHISKSK